MLGLLIQAAICVMLPEQNAGKGSQKILNSLRVQFGQAGDGMFSEILALIQARLKSRLTYGAADFQNAHAFPEEVRETLYLQNFGSLLLLTLQQCPEALICITYSYTMFWLGFITLCGIREGLWFLITN